jgi:hypothetical protein
VRRRAHNKKSRPIIFDWTWISARKSKLLHTKVRDGASKGKMERHFCIFEEHIDGFDAIGETLFPS